MILDISIGTILAAVVPDPLRSRVSGAFMAMNYGTRPVGSLAGGAAGAGSGCTRRSGSPPRRDPGFLSCSPRRCPVSGSRSLRDRVRRRDRARAGHGAGHGARAVGGTGAGTAG